MGLNKEKLSTISSNQNNNQKSNKTYVREPKNEWPWSDLIWNSIMALRNQMQQVLGMHLGLTPTRRDYLSIGRFFQRSLKKKCARDFVPELLIAMFRLRRSTLNYSKWANLHFGNDFSSGPIKTMRRLGLNTVPFVFCILDRFITKSVKKAHTKPESKPFSKGL